MANFKRFKRVKVPIQLRRVERGVATSEVLVVDGWALEGVNAAVVRAPYVKRGAWQVVRASDGLIFVHADSEAKAKASLRKLAEAVAGCDAARELNVGEGDAGREAARLLVQVRRQLIEEGLAY